MKRDCDCSILTVTVVLWLQLQYFDCNCDCGTLTVAAIAVLWPLGKVLLLCLFDLSFWCLCCKFGLLKDKKDKKKTKKVLTLFSDDCDYSIFIVIVIFDCNCATLTWTVIL